VANRTLHKQDPRATAQRNSSERRNERMTPDETTAATATENLAGLTRRNLLKATGGAAAVVAAAATTTAAAPAPAQQPAKRTAAGANETIVLGLIGVGGRGFGNHIDWFGKHPDVAIGAVCDVNQPYVERAVPRFAG
jgi:hypothetical protein